MFVLPKRFDHRWAPSVPENFATKTSLLPVLVTGPPPKSTVEVNNPVTATCPPRSTATPQPRSTLVLPKRLDQRCPPSGEKLATTAACPPALVRSTPPKLIPPVKEPVTATLPAPSAAMP